MKTLVLAAILGLGLAAPASAFGAPPHAPPLRVPPQAPPVLDRVTALEKQVAELTALIEALQKGAPAKKGEAEPLPKGAMARPDGDGWNYDARDNSWWRISPVPTAQPQFLVVPAGGCQNGQCPLPRR